jgi:hypothetical protein
VAPVNHLLAKINPRSPLFLPPSLLPSLAAPRLSKYICNLHSLLSRNFSMSLAKISYRLTLFLFAVRAHTRVAAFPFPIVVYSKRRFCFINSLFRRSLLARFDRQASERASKSPSALQLV